MRELSCEDESRATQISVIEYVDSEGHSSTSFLTLCNPCYIFDDTTITSSIVNEKAYAKLM